MFSDKLSDCNLPLNIFGDLIVTSGGVKNYSDGNDTIDAQEDDDDDNNILLEMLSSRKDPPNVAGFHEVNFSELFNKVNKILPNQTLT